MPDTKMTRDQFLAHPNEALRVLISGYNLYVSDTPNDDDDDDHCSPFHRIVARGDLIDPGDDRNAMPFSPPTNAS